MLRLLRAPLYVLLLVPTWGVTSVTAQGFPLPNIGSLLLGDFIGQAQKAADQLIHNAENSANTLIARAGQAAYLDIQAAKDAYDKSLQKTISELDAKGQEFVSRINQGLGEAQRNAFESASKLLDEATGSIEHLPFASSAPFVFDYTPRFASLATTLEPSLGVVVRGRFKQAAAPGLTPTLTIGAHSLRPASNTLKELQFDISREDIRPLGSPTIPATLVIPYKHRCCFLHLGSRTEKQAYALRIRVLPDSVGTITLSHKEVISWTVDTAIVTDHVRTQNATQQHCGTLFPGWQVVPGTVRVELEFEGGGGSWDKRIITDAGPNICMEVTARDGKDVIWHVAWTQRTTRSREEWRSERVPALWNTSQTFSYAVGTWKVLFMPFDGGKFEASGYTEEHPWLQLSASGAALRIRIPRDTVVR